MTKMIVIGAGVMGASVAFRLAQAGADVTVLEAMRIGGGTSGISFAWTNAHKKPPKPYHDLNVGGMKAHAALKERVRRHALVAWRRQSRMGTRTRPRRSTGECRAAAGLGLRRRVDRPQAGPGTRTRHQSRSHWRRAGRVFSGRRLARPGGLRARHAIRRATPSRRENRLRREGRRSADDRRSGVGRAAGRRHAIRGRHGRQLRRPLDQRGRA